VRILAIDTATESCSAALLLDERILTRDRELARGHAEHILPMIDGLLAEGGVALAALTAIAFGRGPGAFTGVRLAASVTQGLAFGAGLPVVPISDLRALAQRALESDPTVDRVLVCTDARMHEVYWGCFARAPDGRAGLVGDEQVGDPARVRLPEGWHSTAQARAARPDSTEALDARLCAAGSGFAAYPQLGLTVAAGAHSILPGLLPHAREIATLAAGEVAAGRMRPPEEALPVYLRDDVTRPGPVSP
jgi:tRNA threonylcarbamoyladenosine biosynthesis protein TsaB